MQPDATAPEGVPVVGSAGPGGAPSLARRFAALIIDFLVLALPCGALAAVFMIFVVLPHLRHHTGGHAGRGSAERYLFRDYFPELGAVQLLQASMVCAYFTLAHWLFGRTVGKRTFRLKVVSRQGGRMGFGSSLVRAAAFAYTPMLGSLGFVAFAFFSTSVAAVLFMAFGVAGFAWLAGEIISVAADGRERRSLHDRIVASQVVAAA